METDRDRTHTHTHNTASWLEVVRRPKCLNPIRSGEAPAVSWIDLMYIYIKEDQHADRAEGVLLLEKAAGGKEDTKLKVVFFFQIHSIGHWEIFRDSN